MKGHFVYRFMITLINLSAILFFSYCEKNDSGINSETSFSIEGTIQDTETMLPLGGVNISATYNGLSAISDSNGYFFLQGLEQGQEIVVYSLSGYTDYSDTLNLVSDITGHSILLEVDKQELEFDLYAGNWGGNEVIRISLGNLAMADTIYGFPDIISHMVGEPSGRYLYVCTKESLHVGQVVALNLETFSMTTILEGACTVHMALDGTVFVFKYEIFETNNALGVMGIIDPTLNNQITYFDTLAIRYVPYGMDLGFTFDTEKNLVYGVNPDRQLFAYNYSNRQIERIYENIHDPFRMVIWPPTNRLYVAGGPVFDLAADSVLGGVGGGIIASLALNQDGSLLYLTDPGGYILPEPVPTGIVRVFDTNSLMYVGEIDVNKLNGSGSTMTDRVIVHPVDPRVYVNSWSKIFVLDAETNSAIDVIEFVPRNLIFQPLVIVPRLF